MARSACRSPAAPSSCARATSAGTRRPASTTLRGGGPMLDMGPYYITDLVQLLGPVASVMGSTARPKSERLVTSEPMNGTLIPGRGGDPRRRHAGIRERRRRLDRHELRRAEAPARADRDLWRQGQHPGAGSQPVRRRSAGGEDRRRVGRRCRSPTVMWKASSARSASPTWRPRSSTNRPHRASGALALHVLEVMEAFQTSADEGRRVKIESRVERPAMMPAGRDDRTDRLKGQRQCARR